MKIALISDIHSNLEAFQAVKKSLSTPSPDKILFLGDIVGYGADPNECIAMLQNMTDCCLAGNHDYAAIGKTDVNNFNPTAREAIQWTEHKLTKDSKFFLSSLPLKGTMTNFMYVHSTPSHPEDWNYISSLAEAREQFNAFSETICFVGHSHNPMIFLQDSPGKISASYQAAITIKKDCRYIINIGSIGQPRDGNPQSSYGIYDSDKKKYRLIRVSYDITRAQQKIINAGLPLTLARRLALGE